MTIATVGYGDIHPYTNLGRFTMILACIWGAFMMALVVVTITNGFELSGK
jgi:hypothetical protein